MTNVAREMGEKRINGVDTLELYQTIKSVREDPSLGEAHFRLKNRWLGQALNESEVGSFFCAGGERTHKKKLTYRNDEGYVLLGTDEAANPVEFILHGLAGCITTTTVYHAAAHGIEIEELETTLEGDLDLRGLLQTDPSVRSGYQNIRVTMKIKSNASPEKLEELRNFYKFSPVFDTLTKGVKVEVAVKV